MLGWLYVVGLLLGMILVVWGAVSSGLSGAFDRESLYGVLLAIAWPLLVLALGRGHAAPPMPLWARVIVMPLVLGWIALGWWAMISTGWHWLKRRTGGPS